MILGIIQGLTEFLPVSSSGHLVIAQKILGLSSNMVALAIILHLGTLFAVIMFFWKDIRAAIRNLKLLLLMGVATIITGSIGILGKDFFESVFSDYRLVAIALIINGFILILTKRCTPAKSKILGLKDAVILGFAQAIAIIPGISRSGITISTLLFRKLDRQDSFRFSFLIYIPAILGATFLEAKKISFTLKIDLLNVAIGFIFSLLTGLLALWILKLVLQKAKLHYFGYYCMVIAILALLFVK
jgi:undecaprenyl-diphosphatase